MTEGRKYSILDEWLLPHVQARKTFINRKFIAQWIDALPIFFLQIVVWGSVSQIWATNDGFKARHMTSFGAMWRV